MGGHPVLINPRGLLRPIGASSCPTGSAGTKSALSPSTQSPRCGYRPQIAMRAAGAEDQIATSIAIWQ